jgi:hypothetical protein
MVNPAFQSMLSQTHCRGIRRLVPASAVSIRI